MLNAGIGQVNVAGQKNTYHCVRSDTVVRMKTIDGFLNDD